MTEINLTEAKIVVNANRFSIEFIRPAKNGHVTYYMPEVFKTYDEALNAAWKWLSENNEYKRAIINQWYESPKSVLTELCTDVKFIPN